MGKMSGSRQTADAVVGIKTGDGQVMIMS